MTGQGDNPFCTWETEKDRELHEQIAASQVTHPLHLYEPGSPRLERLYEQMAEAVRYQWPSEGFLVNL